MDEGFVSEEIGQYQKKRQHKQQRKEAEVGHEKAQPATSN
jgi:hypothetical protein